MLTLVAKRNRDTPITRIEGCFRMVSSSLNILQQQLLWNWVTSNKTGHTREKDNTPLEEDLQPWVNTTERSYLRISVSGTTSFPRHISKRPFLLPLKRSDTSLQKYFKLIGWRASTHVKRTKFYSAKL